jgi:zinc transport system permease protein
MRGIITMGDILGMAYFQRALLGGILVGGLASYYGTFVVQRGLSFLGSGLAHAAFGGIALGILLGLDPLVVAVPFTLVVAAGIVWLQQRTHLAADTTVGIFFAVSMALGIIFLAMTPRFTTDAFAYLFGSILYVTPLDLWISGALALGALGTSFTLWRRWAFATFDRELAQSEGLPCRRDDYLLALLLAVVTVVSIKVVGMTLIAAFLVIPPAAARLVARTFSGMTILSVLIGISSSIVGMVASVQMDLPPGPVIIMVQAAAFVVALAIRGRR